MKIFRLSKLLSLFIAALICLQTTDGMSAAASSQNRKVHDMMNRRSGRRPMKVSKASTPQLRRTENRQSVVIKEDAVVAVSDKDGSLFGGGPCVNCRDSEDKDGSLFGGGPCVNCHNSGPLIDTGPCKTCRPKPKPQPVALPKIASVAVPYTPVVYQPVSRDCCSMAPLYLEHVDFNLSQGLSDTSSMNKIGNYRFRIFGCRRYDKEAVLNRGRVMEKDMDFHNVFAQATGDCYNLVSIPQDLCLQTTPSPLPEYVLTAEISDIFMNVCDQYNWGETQKQNTRAGSAEITVKWRLSDLTKSRVLWEGETNGYSELQNGAENGEVLLVKEAFADAAKNLQMAYGFEEQLMVRLTPEELSAQRNALIDEEIALNPAKCNFKKELDCVKQCQVSRPDFDPAKCQPIQPVCETVVPAPCPAPVPCPAEVACPPQPCPMTKIEVTQPVVPLPVEIYDVKEVAEPIVENSGLIVDHAVFNNGIDEKGGVSSSGKYVVVDDTWIDVKQNTQALNEICIVDRPPYETLTPENLYKVRASVVEIKNMAGKKGAGLIISESFVLTSADLIDKNTGRYDIRTINGKNLSGKAVRVNPSKNIALIMLDENTEYTPLSLNLDLPKNGQGGYMVLGLLNVDSFADGENHLNSNGKILGYRYSEDKGSEIIVDTSVQTVTIGGVLVDGHGTINGIAHTGVKTENHNDLFLPTETALRSVGLSICEKLYDKSSPWKQTVYKPVTEAILKSAPKAPEVLKPEERK